MTLLLFYYLISIIGGISLTLLLFKFCMIGLDFIRDLIYRITK